MKDEPTKARITDTKFSVGANPQPVDDTVSGTGAVHHHDSKSKKNDKALWCAIFAIIVVILLVCLFFCVLKTSSDGTSETGKDTEGVTSMADTLDPVVVVENDLESVTPESELPTDDVDIEDTETAENNAVKKTETTTYRKDSNTVVIGSVVDTTKVIHYAYDEPIPMAMVEQLPVFPGGSDALYEWLRKNIEYPDSAVRMKIEGKLYAEFVVERDGSVTNIRIN